MRLALALSLVLAPAAEAGWHYSSHYRAGYSYYAAGYYGQSYYPAGYYYYEQPKVYLAAFVQPVYVPAVFATYQPAALAPAYATAPLAAVPAVKAESCHEKLAALEARLKSLEAGQLRTPAQLTPEGAKSDGLAVLVKRCGACHDEASAAEKGGGFALLKGGKLPELTASEVNAVYRQILSGKMPKGSKLGDGEGRAVMEFLDTIRGK